MESRRGALFAKVLLFISQIPAWLRASLFLLVWAGATLLLWQTPTTDVAEHNLIEAAYAGLRLFVFDAPGYPKDLSSRSGQALWGLIFAAPLITAAATADFVRRHVLAPEILVRGYDNHVIICGLGQHGRAIARRYLAVSDYNLVFVDRDWLSSGHGVDIQGSRSLFIRGDMTDPDVLLNAGLPRAAQIVFASGDPIVNLEAARAAHEALEFSPAPPRIRVLVDEEQELSLILDELQIVRERFELIDQFQIVARHLIQHGLLSALRADSGPRHVTFLGFGRFGQALLRELAACNTAAAPLPLQIEIVDQKYRSRRLVFGDILSQQGWEEIDAGETDIEMWVAQRISDTSVRWPQLILFCIDDDALTLRCAARLRRSGCTDPAQTLLILRTAKELTGSRTLQTVNVPRIFADEFSRGEPL